MFKGGRDPHLARPQSFIPPPEYPTEGRMAVDLRRTLGGMDWCGREGAIVHVGRVRVGTIEY